MAVSMALQRNTGLLRWVALPSWAALRWRVITAESFGWDRKITSKQEEEAAEATFRLEVSSQMRYRGRAPRKKVLKNQFFKKKISSPLLSNIYLPSCRACRGVRIFLCWQDSALMQTSGRLPRHRQGLCREQCLPCMRVPQGWTATWSPWCQIKGECTQLDFCCRGLSYGLLSLHGFLTTALLWDLCSSVKRDWSRTKGFKRWMVQTPMLFLQGNV